MSRSSSIRPRGQNPHARSQSTLPGALRLSRPSEAIADPVSSAPLPPEKKSLSEIFCTHAFSAVRGFGYGVAGSIVTLAGSLAMSAYSDVAFGLSFAVGCALTWKAAAYKPAPKTGVLSSMFGGVACVGGILLGSAMLLSPSDAKPHQNGKPLRGSGTYDIKADPAQMPTKPSLSLTMI